MIHPAVTLLVLVAPLGLDPGLEDDHPAHESAFGARLPLPLLEHAPRGSVPFDPLRVFLAPTAEELGGDIDLARKLADLASRDLGRSRYQGAAAGGHGLGDVVRRFVPVRDDPQGILRELERLRAEAPNVAREVDWFLPQLLDARALHAGGDWKANRDQPDDGLYAAGGWQPDHERWRSAWPELDRGRALKAGQVAALIFPAPSVPAESRTGAATLERYLAAVHDFAAYPKYRGLTARYKRVELVGPVSISADGRTAVTRTRNELARRSARPFTLTMRERLADDGRFVADSHATDGPFTLIAVCTQVWPLFDAEGGFVCLLVVSQMAAGPGDPDTLLRGSLGNLKRRAEAAG